jgi:hypothetical protein
VYNNLAILEVIGQSPSGLPYLNPAMPINLLIRVLLDSSIKFVHIKVGNKSSNGEIVSTYGPVFAIISSVMPPVYYRRSFVGLTIASAYSTVRSPR